MRYVLITALAGLVIVPAHASDRYGEKPPIGVSTNLASPWMLQMKQNPVENAPSRATMSTAFQRSILQNRRNTADVQKYLQEQQNIQRQQQERAKAVANAAAEKRHKQKLAALAQTTKQNTPKSGIKDQFLPQIVSYSSNHKRGTVVIDTQSRFLYLVLGNGEAKRYGVGVGKAGFEWTGSEKITRKKEWPSWTPPKEMIAREAAKGRNLPNFMPGGPENPLGARALYLGNTLYRIHGTNAPWTIGQAMSSGCIRMRNEDVSDLYERVPIGATVHVI